MRKLRVPEGQGSLFDAATPRPPAARPQPPRPPSPERAVSEAPTKAVETRSGKRGTEKWKMPQAQGSTVAEIRLLWSRRLTPGQAARVESELAALPAALGKLGFGAVKVERSFVRRRRN